MDSWVERFGRASEQKKATVIYRRTRNPRARQLLLGHTELGSTVRYLGIEVNDVLEMAEQTEGYAGLGRSAVVADWPEPSFGTSKPHPGGGRPM